MAYPFNSHRRPAALMATRAARTATITYQRAKTSKRQLRQEVCRLQQENQWLRGEVRRRWDAIDVLGRAMEASEGRWMREMREVARATRWQGYLECLIDLRGGDPSVDVAAPDGRSSSD